MRAAVQVAYGDVEQQRLSRRDAHARTRAPARSSSASAARHSTARICSRSSTSRAGDSARPPLPHINGTDAWGTVVGDGRRRRRMDRRGSRCRVSGAVLRPLRVVPAWRNVGVRVVRRASASSAGAATRTSCAVPARNLERIPTDERRRARVRRRQLVDGVARARHGGAASPWRDVARQRRVRRRRHRRDRHWSACRCARHCGGRVGVEDRARESHRARRGDLADEHSRPRDGRRSHGTAAAPMSRSTVSAAPGGARRSTRSRASAAWRSAAPRTAIVRTSASARSISTTAGSSARRSDRGRSSATWSPALERAARARGPRDGAARADSRRPAHARAAASASARSRCALRRRC